jgi:cobalt-zinc-cadmium efflux system outer membrane protein
MKPSLCLLFCFFLLISHVLFAQKDTLQISLDNAEKIFIEKNYQLLAQKYNIKIAEAGIRQAGLWANPNLFLQSNFYNPQTGKFFQYGVNTPEDIAASQYNKGGMSVQLQQLIYLAGKRSKLVKLAESDRNLQQLAFEDLLRTLKFQLYSTYASLHFDLQSYSLLKQEADRQQDLVKAFQILLGQGGASQYEVTRLEAEWQSLQTDLVSLSSRIAEEEASLRILLQLKENTFLKTTQPPVLAGVLPDLKTALDTAAINRPDYKIANESLENANRSLTVEKARQTPDLMAGFLFDRYGNSFNNYTGLNVAMDLPVFNRNQGKVAAAKIQVENAKKGIENQQLMVQNEVMQAYEKLQNVYKQNAAISADYQTSLQNISIEATRNYNRKIINLLDYLDKIKTYKQAQLNLINLRNNLFQTQQYFNYVTNTRFF